MATVRREKAGPSHCAYCGQPIASDRPVIERFGEPFCSERHADEFTAGVRAARVGAAAGRPAPEPAASSHSHHAPGGRSGAWIAGVVIVGVLGGALLWGNSSGSAFIPGAGFLLTALLLLACPLGMYFMMRGMGHGGNGRHGTGDQSASERRTTRPGERRDK